MGIRIIGYQPVRFRTTEQIAQENCDCQGQCFCQLVNKNDATTWQINSDNEVLNGTFDTDLEHWNIGESLGISVIITNESAEGECDGELVITATGGTGPYTYSKDGVTFQSSDTFSALCEGCYNIVVKDSLDNIGFYTACVGENITCGAYDETDELLPFQTNELLNCLTSDFI